VYAVAFHPTQPMLASASADFTVKIWVPQKTAVLLANAPLVSAGGRGA